MRRRRARKQKSHFIRHQRKRNFSFNTQQRVEINSLQKKQASPKENETNQTT